MSNAIDNRIDLSDKATFTRILKLYDNEIYEHILAIFTQSTIATVDESKIARLIECGIRVKRDDNDPRENQVYEVEFDPDSENRLWSKLDRSDASKWWFTY